MQGGGSGVRALGVGVHWRGHRDGSRYHSPLDELGIGPRGLPSRHHPAEPLLPSVLLPPKALGAGGDRPPARVPLLPCALGGPSFSFSVFSLLGPWVVGSSGLLSWSVRVERE